MKILQLQNKGGYNINRQELINYLNENVGVKKIVDLDKYNKFIDAFMV